MRILPFAFYAYPQLIPTHRVRPGMSGSPLLNRETGCVCGIVQFTLDRNIDLGGKAMLSKVVFREFPELEARQKQFHQQD